MSSKIDVITSGYATIVVKSDTQQAHQGSEPGSAGAGKYMKATGSCCLVQSGGFRVLFDTMGPWEKDILLERLAIMKIHPDDIDYLVCSHSHADHVGNLNLFIKAKKHLVGTLGYTGDVYDMNTFEPIGSHTYISPKNSDQEIEVINYEPFKIDSNLSVEATPGHTMECVSMIVKNCDTYGTVGLAGDLFENEQDVTDESIWILAGSQNPDFQRAHRTRLYNCVDYILPGHGPLFKTKALDIRF